jgi:hypothetical protein
MRLCPGYRDEAEDESELESKLPQGRKTNVVIVAGGFLFKMIVNERLKSAPYIFLSFLVDFSSGSKPVCQEHVFRYSQARMLCPAQTSSTNLPPCTLP